MQILNAPPRDHLTAAQVTGLLTGPDLQVEAGLELLDTTNRFLADISANLGEGGSVSWDNRNSIHGSVSLSLQIPLSWGRDRVRPYMTLSNATTSARFNLGVFVLTRPIEERGEDPVTYQVAGRDLLSLLASTGPADTWNAIVGTTYFTALQAIVTASGIGAPLQIDGDLSSVTIPATRVWALMDPIPSWLGMMTDLLEEIGYVPPWIDPDGNIRSRRYLDPASRASEWTLDVADTETNIVAESRSVTTEVGDVANWWRFVMANATVTPVEGSGLYTPPANQSDGPNSIDATGLTRRKFVPLEAADQAALVAQGKKIVAEDKASVTTIRLQIDPLPIMGFDDIFTLVDGGPEVKLAASSWELSLNGGQGALLLGGAPPLPSVPVEVQAKASVTQAAPLRVVVDGATTSSFANALDAATYAVGARVTLTVRNPLPPLVIGVESS